jgi:prolyl oligopeptidase
VTGFDRPLATYTWSDYATNLRLDKSPNSTPIPIAVKQLWTESKDGTKVPYFLVHAKQWTSSAPTPTVVSGYGGFNVPMLPAYSPSVRRWVEEGGLYVMATLRGGSEFGETWHQGGMRAQKQNVFDDFEAVIMDVQRRGYTDPAHTAISGRSNGGLLVGATLTQRPDLIAAVVSGVPLLDMIRYPYFQIAALWTHEYGSPDNADDFRILLQYSPYHNVRNTINYPATLIFTSEEDSRVDPLHARKMVALLQNLPGQQRPIYLRVQSSAGHGVGKTVDQWVGEEADIWTFITNTLKG